MLMVSLSFCRPAEIVENGAVYPASNGYASPRAGARQSECPIRPPTLRLSIGPPTHTHRRIHPAIYLSIYPLYTCPFTHSPLVHMYPPTHLHIRPPIPPTLHLCVYPSIHLFIHPSIHAAVHSSCPPDHPHSKSIQPLTRLPRPLALSLTHPPIHPATTHTPSIHHPPSTHPPT